MCRTVQNSTEHTEHTHKPKAMKPSHTKAFQVTSNQDGIKKVPPELFLDIKFPKINFFFPKNNFLVENFGPKLFQVCSHVSGLGCLCVSFTQGSQELRSEQAQNSAEQRRTREEHAILGPGEQFSSKGVSGPLKAPTNTTTQHKKPKICDITFWKNTPLRDSVLLVQPET
mgnify:CR=1 FL=1